MSIAACAHEAAPPVHTETGSTPHSTPQIEDDYRAQLDRSLRSEGDASAVLTDQEILDYATQPISPTKEDHRVLLGTHNGTPVRADYPCSDECPEHTTRVVYYAVPDAECERVDGELRGVHVPYGISVKLVAFCFPRILITNWREYLERSVWYGRRDGTRE
jgi:hypothetical protein